MTDLEDIKCKKMIETYMAEDDCADTCAHKKYAKHEKTELAPS